MLLCLFSFVTCVSHQSRIRKTKKMFSHGSALVSVCDGMVIVGWLGRGTTTLHCTHYVWTCRFKRHQSTFSFPPSLALWLARCPLQPRKLPWAWLAGHSPTSSGVSSERGIRALPRSGISTGSLPQLLL